jgi:Tfp pilus assembly protein PilO
VAELTNNHKNLLRVSIIGGVLLSGLFGWLGYEDFKARETALEQIAVKHTEIDKADAQIREIPRLEEKIIVLRETVNSYVRILPDDKEINEFVDKLTDFAARTEVRIKKLDDEDVRARTGRNQKGATAAFDRVVYKLSIEGTCEQLLCFMDLFENHERFVKIGSFKIDHRVAPQANVDAMTIPHQIDLDLETYVYNAKVRSKENVVIPQEAQKLERLQAEGLIGDDAASTIMLASYKHEPAPTRRDLFYDPRVSQSLSDQEDALEMERQTMKLQVLVDRVQKATNDLTEEGRIENLVKRLQASEKNNRELLALGSEISKAQTDRIFTVEEVKDRFEREVEKPYARLVEGRPLDQTNLAAVADQIAEDVEKMRVAVRDSRWDEAVTLFDGITRLFPMAKGDDVKALMKEATDLHRTAKAHLDFLALALSFGGAVCFENDPAHAVAIINGRSYGPGESVDHDLVVKTISSSSILFDYRGVAVTQPMKAIVAPTTKAPARSTTPKQAPNAPRRKPS